TMRVAYLECFSGISGDMMLGALLQASVSQELLQQMVAALNIGAELRISRVDRSGISATKVDVLVNGKPAEQPPNSDEHVLHKHSHDHSHAHDHANMRQTLKTEVAIEGHHSHSHVHGRDDGRGRSLSEIRDIIRRADIPHPARETAIRAFELLGDA